MAVTFTDRIEAGRQLAAALQEYQGSEVVVLGLARGGVVVGVGVAEALGVPLRPLVVRKIGAPDNPELALGAVSETGVQWLDPSVVRLTGATEAHIQSEVEAQVEEARRRQREYRMEPGLEIVRGHPVIVVDDGIATGATALVAVRSARGLAASRVILATPVASSQAARLLEPEADRFLALSVPDPFLAVGYHYKHFEQVGDDEVRRYLHLVNSGS